MAEARGPTVLKRILPYGDSRKAGFSGPQRHLKPSWAGPLPNGNTRDSLGATKARRAKVSQGRASGRWEQ